MLLKQTKDGPGAFRTSCRGHGFGQKTSLEAIEPMPDSVTSPRHLLRWRGYAVMAANNASHPDTTQLPGEEQREDRRGTRVSWRGETMLTHVMVRERS